MDEFEDIKDNPFLQPTKKHTSYKKQKSRVFFRISKQIWNKKINIIKKNRAIISFVAIIIFSIFSFSVMYNINKKPNSGDESDIVVTKLEKGNPEFKTLTPNGKSITEYGGWTKVSPTGSDPVYTYIDNIDLISINVSQQKLPDNFSGDLDNQLQLLAKSFNADEKITSSKTVFYISTARDGSQSIIFSKNNLLILIKSVAKISNDSWLKYLESLK